MWKMGAAYAALRLLGCLMVTDLPMNGNGDLLPAKRSCAAR